MLLQLADFLRGLELTRIKFASHEETASDRVFFGTQGNLNRSYIKKFKWNRMER